MIIVTVIYYEKNGKRSQAMGLIWVFLGCFRLLSSEFGKRGLL